jgi:hypothetical protein
MYARRREGAVDIPETAPEIAQMSGPPETKLMGKPDEEAAES